MILRATAVAVGAAGGGLGVLFILLSIGDASGWDTWPGRLALGGLGASAAVGMAGAAVAWRHPLIGALVFAFSGGALVVLPYIPSALLVLAAGLCLIDALRSSRRARE